MNQTDSPWTGWPIFPTRVLPTFLQGVKGHRQPVILDIGPVVGPNIQFLVAQRLKVHVHDVLSGWQVRTGARTVGDGTPVPMGDGLTTPLDYPAQGFDGILCWDTLDVIDPLSARRLICQLHDLLKPGGLILGLFGPTGRVFPLRAKFVIVDERHLAYGWASTSRPHDHAYDNQHIQAVFSGFGRPHLYLLRNGMREILFRKAGAAAHAPAPHGHQLPR